VNSFAANIDPAATLRNGRVAEVTALISCNDGDDAHVILNLEQGEVTGGGQVSTRCEGRLLRIPMTIPAQGASGFEAGAATAHVEGIVRSAGSIIEDTRWTRQVTLAFEHQAASPALR
jgi:hypothetical protein